MDRATEKLSKDQETLDLSPLSRLLFSVRENNKSRALQTAQSIIEEGMPGILRDPVMEWKFFMVKMLTLLTNMFGGGTETSEFMEHHADKILVHVDACRTVADCEELFAEIIRDFCEVNEELGAQSSVLVRNVMEHVSLDLTKPLTLHYFAEMMNVNSSYLSNLFRKQVGMTLTEYVTEKRLAHAASLLVFTALPIKQVARASGIPDVQYFSRLFRKRMNMTPSRYREENSRSSLQKYDRRFV